MSASHKKDLKSANSHELALAQPSYLIHMEPWKIVFQFFTSDDLMDMYAFPYFFHDDCYRAIAWTLVKNLDLKTEPASAKGDPNDMSLQKYFDQNPKLKTYVTCFASGSELYIIINPIEILKAVGEEDPLEYFVFLYFTGKPGEYFFLIELRPDVNLKNFHRFSMGQPYSEKSNQNCYALHDEKSAIFMSPQSHYFRTFHRADPLVEKIIALRWFQTIENIYKRKQPERNCNASQIITLPSVTRPLKVVSRRLLYALENKQQGSYIRVFGQAYNKTFTIQTKPSLNASWVDIPYDSYRKGCGLGGHLIDAIFFNHFYYQSLHFGCCKIEVPLTTSTREQHTCVIVTDLEEKENLEKFDLASVHSPTPFDEKEKLEPLGTVKKHLSALQSRTLIDFFWKNGREHEEKANFEESLFCFEQAILLSPQNPFYHKECARILNHLGRFQEAIRSSFRSIALAMSMQGLPIQTRMNDQPEAPYFHLGNAYFALENYEDAIAAYQQGSYFAPKESDFYWMLAKSYEYLLRWDEALKNYHQYLTGHKTLGSSDEARQRIQFIIQKISIRPVSVFRPNSSLDSKHSVPKPPPPRQHMS